MMFRNSSIARILPFLAILVISLPSWGQNITWSNDTVYACDSYLWPANGHTYTSGSGLSTPTDTACSNDTCRRLFLILNHTTRITLNDTIVENQLPHTFRNNTYYDFVRNRSITVPATTQGACDTIFTYSLYIYWNVYSRVDSTICENQLPLQWHHRTFQSASTKRDTIPTQHGADSIITMALHVLHNSHSTYYDTVVQRQLPHTFHNHTAYNDENNITVVIPNSQGCDSIINYNLYVHHNIERTVDTAVCESNLPFRWYNRQLTRQGHYTDTLIAAAPNGQDSVIHLNLTVGHHHINVIRDTIVENQLPHHFLDTTYTAPTLNDEFTIRQGSICDSLILYSLHIWYNVFDTADTNICNNQTPFLWNGHRFVGNGSAQVTLRGCHGQDSTLLMNVYVHSMARSNIFDTIVENQLPYTFNGQLISQDGLSIINLQGAAVGGCDSIIVYNLFVHRNSHTHVDSAICENILPLRWDGLLFQQAGTRSYTYPAANGADSIVEYTLIVHSNNNIYQTFTACDTFVWAVNGRTYTASTRNPHVDYTNRFGCDSIIHLNLTLGHTTRYTDIIEACDSYRWINRREYRESITGPTVTDTNASGCDSIITLSLTIYYSADTTIEITANDVFFWNGETYRQSGSYAAHFTTIHGCDSTVTLNLTILQQGILNPQHETITIHPNPTKGPVTIHGVQPTSIDIFDIAGRKVASFGSTLQLNLSNLPAGSYTLLIHTPSATHPHHIIIQK
ncbi:MAG: T9SS type A sorting domain-containing protein [Bacteroidales bacterium]|nr:T9SS type A sorting domain-containing protein [Bacteroidales bacterium]